MPLLLKKNAFGCILSTSYIIVNQYGEKSLWNALLKSAAPPAKPTFQWQ